MKITEIRSKKADELKKQLDELGKEQFNLRFQASNGQLNNTGRVKEVRRGIAKIKTIFNEKKGKE
ncbi:MAG: 50S ribosomal protein L29 [SAR116 cluster bacterium]|nr:50S ribosomal protein L29 [SAR116 cluster bacterium]